MLFSLAFELLTLKKGGGATNYCLVLLLLRVLSIVVVRLPTVQFRIMFECYFEEWSD